MNLKISINAVRMLYVLQSPKQKIKQQAAEVFSMNGQLRNAESLEHMLKGQAEMFDNVMHVVSDLPKTGLKPLWVAYTEQHDGRMAEAKRYARDGNQFMAGVTSGSAHADVALDVLGVAGLGYGVIRGGGTGARALNRFVKANDFKSPIVFKFESGRLNSGIPLDSVKPQKPWVKKADKLAQGKLPDNLKQALTSGRFIELASNVNKLEAKVIVSDLQHILSEAQIAKVLKTIKQAPGGEKAKVLIKYSPDTKNVRLVLERPGHNGFQRFSHEISIEGTRGTVVQTAYDLEGSLVSQNPGASKNNLFDVKKYKG